MVGQHTFARPCARALALRFHATLKPPMHLAAGCSEAGLREAIAALARRTPRFELSALSLQRLADFIALRPVARRWCPATRCGSLPMPA